MGIVGEYDNHHELYNLRAITPTNESMAKAIRPLATTEHVDNEIKKLEVSLGNKMDKIPITNVEKPHKFKASEFKFEINGQIITSMKNDIRVNPKGIIALQLHNLSEKSIKYYSIAIALVGCNISSKDSSWLSGGVTDYDEDGNVEKDNLLGLVFFGERSGYPAVGSDAKQSFPDIQNDCAEEKSGRIVILFAPTQNTKPFQWSLRWLKNSL